MQDSLGSLGALNDGGIIPGLSMKQRVKYFIYSFGGATACLFLSFALLAIAMLKAFAMLISLSNIGYVIATGLIVGPKRQLKAIVKPKRAGCAAAFLLFWVLTLVSAFNGGTVVVLVFALCQVAAYLYYLLSYIPYGRKGAQKLVSSAMK